MYIQLNSQVIYYEKSGEGTPIILLHGNGESHEIFDKIIPELSKTHTVYAMDSRGQGESATPKEFHYQDMANDVVALIDALSIDKPAIYGFSDGAIIGLLVAISHPDLLSKLIISGANLNFKGLAGSARREIKNHFKKTGDSLYKMMMEEPNISEQELAAIKIPVLITVGEKDMVKPAETKRIHQAISDSTLYTFPKEDHSSYVVHSDQMLELLKEFL